MSKKKKPKKNKETIEDVVDPAMSTDENETSTEDAVDDPIQILEKTLQETREELAEQKDTFIRLQAETDNFRKRITREKDEFSQYANERLLKALIPIFDNFERALEAPSSDVNNLREGLDMILKQFNSFLEKEKVEQIKAIGEMFDPSIHEVLTSEESDEHEENTVIRQFVKGYMINGRVLRPTQVVIAKKSSAKKEDSPESEKEENLAN